MQNGGNEAKTKDNHEARNTSKNISLECLAPIITGLGKTLGKDFEFVLHDFSQADASIIAIENAHVTERNIGAPSTDFLIEYIALQKKAPEQYPDLKLNYLSKTKDGRNLKSSLIMLRDVNNNLVGCICINIDLTDIEVSKYLLEDLLYLEDNTNNNKPEERFPSDVNEFLGFMIEKALTKINKPIYNMNKEDKLAIIKYLFEHNVFNIKGAIDNLAAVLNVSRHTVYNYLEEVKYSSQ